MRGRANPSSRRRTGKRPVLSTGRQLLAATILTGLVVGAIWLRTDPVASAALLSPAPFVGRQGEVSGQFPLCSAGQRRHCVVDGDTFYMARDKIRIADIDAPETHPPRCVEEADLGERATQRLSALLSSAPFELVRADRDEDRYGRKLRIVMIRGKSVGEMLVDEGIARRWTGHRKPWCTGTAAG